jgi:SAM-dependent methyltransferase
MAINHKCLVCNSYNNSFHLRCKDYFTSGEDFDIFKCNNCGFVFTKNPPPESEIGNYYNTGDYISHSDSKKGLINFLFHFSRSLMLHRKRNIISMTTCLKSGTLLDIGCGTGYFAAFMQKHGWDVTGVEVNEKAREYAKSRFDLEVLSGNEFAESIKGQFDCIALWHVLEHFHDPLKYLSRINSLLKNDGVCIVAIPNSGSFDANYFRNYWAAYDVPRHLWHFDQVTFKMFSESHGLIVENISTLPLDVFYISILSEKYKGSKLPFLSGMIKGLQFAFLSLFNKRRSSSNIYILRKLQES